MAAMSQYGFGDPTVMRDYLDFVEVKDGENVSDDGSLPSYSSKGEDDEGAASTRTKAKPTRAEATAPTSTAGEENFWRKKKLIRDVLPHAEANVEDDTDSDYGTIETDPLQSGFDRAIAHARRFRAQYEEGAASLLELKTLAALRTNFIDTSQLLLEDQYEELQKRDHGFTQQHVRGLLSYLRRTMKVKEPDFAKTDSSEIFLVSKINALEKTVKQFIEKAEKQEDLKVFVRHNGMSKSTSKILSLQGYKEELIHNAQRVLAFDEDDIEDENLLNFESRFFEMLNFESHVTDEEHAAFVAMAPQSENLEIIMKLFMKHLSGSMPALLQHGYIRHGKPIISIGSGTDQDVSMETFLNGLSYGENQAIIHDKSGITENKYIERILCDNAYLPYSNIILELQLMNKLCFSGIDPMVWANTVNITFCGGAIIIFNHWMRSKNKEQVSLKVVKKLLVPGRNKRVTMNDRNKTIKVQISATEIHDILMRKKAVMKQDAADEEYRKELIEAMNRDQDN